MQLTVQHNAKITALIVSVLIYSCCATDGSSATVRSPPPTTGGHNVVGKGTHQSNRPPEQQPAAKAHNGAGARNGHSSSSVPTSPTSSSSSSSTKPQHSLGHGEKSKSSYAMLSQAMTEAVHHEFSSKYPSVVRWIPFDPSEIFPVFLFLSVLR